MQRSIDAHWEFHCPECGLGHQEHGRLARDHELFCEICEHEAGRAVKLQRWLNENPIRNNSSDAS